MSPFFAWSLLLLAGLAPLLQAEDSRVSVTEKITGKTPQIIGINTGEMPEGSAFPEWARAMGVNGARLRLNAVPSKEADGEIYTLGDLENRARRLRSSAKQETPKLWTHPSKVAASSLQALRGRRLNFSPPSPAPTRFSC